MSRLSGVWKVLAVPMVLFSLGYGEGHKHSFLLLNDIVSKTCCDSVFDLYNVDRMDTIGVTFGKKEIKMTGLPNGNYYVKCGDDRFEFKYRTWYQEPHPLILVEDKQRKKNTLVTKKLMIFSGIVMGFVGTPMWINNQIKYIDHQNNTKMTGDVRYTPSGSSSRHSTTISGEHIVDSLIGYTQDEVKRKRNWGFSLCITGSLSTLIGILIKND